MKISRISGIHPPLALVLILACLSFSLFGQEGGNAGIITDIEIIGLKRTKPRIARYTLEQFLGRDGDTLDHNEVRAALMDTGVLEPRSVELIPGEKGSVLRVTVDEKWSIIPLPLVMAGSGSFAAGLFVLDTNAFGLQDQAAAGGMYSSGGWMAMGMYNHTPDRRGRPGWNTSFMYGRREREDTDREEKVHRRYTADTLNASLGLNYPLFGPLSAEAGISFTRIFLVDNPDALNDPREGAALLGFSPGLKLRFSDWDGYFLSERSASLGYAYKLGISGPSAHAVNFRGIYEKSLIPGFQLDIRSGALWQPGADMLFEEGPHSAQVDILPGDFSAQSYAGISLGVEKYLVKFRHGTLSLLGSYQLVYSRGPISGDEFDHGPSGGIRFYLSRIAIPALGLSAAYNVRSGLAQFGFSLGVAF